MLTKLVSLQNIGRFTAFKASGDVTFRNLTLIYGENGQGKTTITGVLRSLKTGDPTFISERATLGGGLPEVELLVDKRRATFKAGKWSETVPEIEVFDTTFVNDNVHAGERVDPEQKKNLYEVVVGASAVALQRRIDALDTESRAVAKQVRELEAELRKVVQAPFELAAFLALATVPDADEQITRLTTDLTASRAHRELLARRDLDPLPVHALPTDLLDRLGRGVDGVTMQAERAVKDHCARLDADGERWMREGVHYLERRDDCPFCARPIADSQIVELFRSYFSEAYNEHIVSLKRIKNQIDVALGEATWSALQAVALANRGKIDVWRDLIDLSAAYVDLDRVQAAWRHARTVLSRAIETKLASPLDTPSMLPDVKAALGDLNIAFGILATTNAAIGEANESIADRKQQAAVQKVEELEAQIRVLRNSQIRRDSAVAVQCDALIEANARKKSLESEKADARESFDEGASTELSAYEKEINELLIRFGAGFSLAGIKTVYPGGKVSSTYTIVINSRHVELGDAKTPRGTPCFRTALSAGDKSTLALAFFLARLRRDPDVGSRVVVLDDPLSSLDVFRKTCTCEEIGELVGRAAQVIVLSHDPGFIKAVFDRTEAADRVCLAVGRSKTTSVIREWDPEDMFRSQSDNDQNILQGYIDQGGDDRDRLILVARSIRTFLEGRLRARFPGAFAGAKTFGAMIDRIRDSSSNPALQQIAGLVSELDALNVYSREFHHGGKFASVAPNSIELQTYAARALKCMGT